VHRRKSQQVMNLCANAARRLSSVSGILVSSLSPTQRLAYHTISLPQYEESLLPSVYPESERTISGILPALNRRGIFGIPQAGEWLVPNSKAHETLEVLRNNKLMVLGVGVWAVKQPEKVPSALLERTFEHLLIEHEGGAEELAEKCATEAAKFIGRLHKALPKNKPLYISFVTTENWV